ncbi:hypothetical protein [Paenibacillus daejeonensis]|uniref:hypothetical protein n=1 Tax=Paenibacillus daejeonensis TaxID=135193 RepID=UPI00036F5052|nr:hypothetical protein [Paenibacillus daejeonensis]
MEPFKRRTPEELLASYYRMQRGRFKIYLGAVSGSGKTYHMLREGHDLQDRGIDVVLSAISTRQGGETAAQMGNLEQVPAIPWTDGEGVIRHDLDVAALLQRHPEVVLVDDLAHRNRGGAQRAGRLDDIQLLLANGISVIVTVNGYELEGVADLARQYAGIAVRSTLPADTLDLADEVRLIDATPETLLTRLAEGRLCQSDGAVFRRGKLAKLRELALRLVAADVHDDLAKHRIASGQPGLAGGAERILVSVQYLWNASIYIRRGQQVAKRLGGDLLVVSFIDPAQPFAKEAAAFRQSVMKLAEKVGAPFEEVPCASRRLIAHQLSSYAATHSVTRIVMGHSKQSAWQEWRRGSVIGGLLRRMAGVDLLLVADSSERGERVLPAKSYAAPRDEAYRRKKSEELASTLQAMGSGKLKVYIGAAPGVGKTYAMLKEGNELLAKGVDAVIGLLETHGRMETAAQIGSLDQLPRVQQDYRGSVLEEMDLAGILGRRPEVVLIDELAHTNMPGSRNRKRYEDVEQLLHAGISVIATVNVQHLESLNDAVEQATGIRVRETVPDRLLRLADEVQLIDVSPVTLRTRMQEGKIYAPASIEQALHSFFKTVNLIALRELALREIADDVDERLEAWERKASLRGPWRRKESIVVAVSLGSVAERLIRRGFRIAHRLKAKWHVLHIRAGAEPSPIERERLDRLTEITMGLGGRFEVVEARTKRELALLVLQAAAERHATQLILGQPRIRSWGGPVRFRSVVGAALRQARHLDVLIVSRPPVSYSRPHDLQL